jgi:hypothetical protein
MPCPALDLRDFHKRTVRSDASPDSMQIPQTTGNPHPVRLSQESDQPIAPNSVTRLWTGCTRLKIHVLTRQYFSLTENSEGVEQHCSLTAS